MEKFIYLFIYFIIYSFIGWICELVWLSFERKDVVTKTGFLNGPICPIYGIGSLIIVYFLGKYENDIFALFVLSMLSCSILEYFVSWLFEKIFNDRWWDYSHVKFNINGRVCLINSLAFGFGAVIIVHYFHPFLVSVVGSMPLKVIYSFANTCFFVFVTDLIVTLNIAIKFRKYIKLIKERRKRIFGKSTLKYGIELFNKLNEFNKYSIKVLLKKFPKLLDSKDKELEKIFKELNDDKK